MNSAYHIGKGHARLHCPSLDLNSPCVTPFFFFLLGWFRRTNRTRPVQVFSHSLSPREKAKLQIAIRRFFLRWMNVPPTSPKKQIVDSAMSYPLSIARSLGAHWQLLSPFDFRKGCRSTPSLHLRRISTSLAIILLNTFRCGSWFNCTVCTSITFVSPLSLSGKTF